MGWVGGVCSSSDTFPNTGLCLDDWLIHNLRDWYLPQSKVKNETHVSVFSVSVSVSVSFGISVELSIDNG